MREVLFVSKPVAPPWTDSNKNLVRALAHALTRYRARVLVPRGIALDGIVCDDVYRAPGRWAPALSANARVLLRLLAGRRADLWHFFFAPNPRTLQAGRLATRLRKVPAVHTIASAPDDLERIAPLLFADRVVTLSAHTRARLAACGVSSECIPPALGSVACAPEAVDAARRRHALPEHYVLYPGDLEYSDGAQTFVHAAALGRDLGWVVAARPKSRAAGAALARVQDEARRLGARVTWLGELDDMHAVIAGAQVVALTANTLHAKMDYPLVLLEALALGVPIVVAAGTAAAELEASGGALSVPAGDGQALVRACESLAGDAARRATMGARGHAWVTEHCDPATVAAAYERVYDGL